MWNYLQGGDDHFALDRAAGDAQAEAFPDIFHLARQARRFLSRAVRHTATDGDIHQFLDLGCGLPVPDDLENVHEIAQDIHPDSRVVYVDHDRVVVSYADALLTSKTGEGVTAHIEADIRDPAPVLTQAAQTLDLTRPVAVLMLGVLGHIADFDEACATVDGFMAAMPGGSYLIVHDGHDDGYDDNKGVREGVARRNETGIAPYHLRTGRQFQRYFHDLDVLDPGIVPVTTWRPDHVDPTTIRPVAGYCGVGRKVGPHR
jgi:hypothetical protein